MVEGLPGHAVVPPLTSTADVDRQGIAVVASVGQRGIIVAYAHV